MTNEPKFFDPETGKPLHRVPDGAMIPKGTPYGFIRPNGTRGWEDGGAGYTFNQLRDHTYFTREPIAPPLPTEPGYYLDKDGDLWHVNDSGERALLMKGGRAFDFSYHPWWGDDRKYGPFTPVAIVPTKTWERLRVFDPEVKLDRVDAEGRVWRYRERYDRWESENGDCFYYLEAMDSQVGPLRFADEVSDR